MDEFDQRTDAGYPRARRTPARRQRSGTGSANVRWRWALPPIDHSPFYWVSWAVVLGIGVLCLLRVMRVDDGLTQLMPMIPLFLLPLSAAVLYGVFGDGLAPGWLALFLMAVVSGWVSQDLGGGQQRVDPEGAQVLQVATSNIKADNPTLNALLTEIAATDPDVVLLQEVTPEAFETVLDHPLADMVPNVFARPRDDYYGIVTLSKYPIAEEWERDGRGFPILITDIETPNGEVRVINAHAPAPVSPDMVTAWKDYMSVLRGLQADGYMVMAGDFNGTIQNREIRELADAGWLDVHRVSGHGIAPTYSAAWPVRYVLRLDRVFISPGMTSLTTWRGAGPGSDHVPVFARVALGVFD